MKIFLVGKTPRSPGLSCALFTMEMIVLSCIRGYHIYGEVWTVIIGEQLLCEREPGNVVDRYAVAVQKDLGVTVGHLPWKISRMCNMFTQRGGEITATVTDHEESSLDTKYHATNK